MDKKSLRVLLVEDNPTDAELILRALRGAGFAPEWQRVDTEEEFTRSLDPKIDIVLSDYVMPQFSGLRALELLKESELEIPFILVSGTIGEETAVEAMRSGATDYLLKDRLVRLGQAVERALEQKRLRDEHRRTEERLREQADIISRARDAVIIRDFGSDIITFWNEGAEHLYGWSAGEAIGRRLGDLMFAEPTDRGALLEKLVSTGEYHGEIKHRCKDGREVAVDSRTTLIRNDDGTPRAVLGINSDVTEKKKLEMQLLRAQRLESIGTLAGGVAHDLNNILTPILMCSEMLHNEQSEEDRQSTIALIEESAHRGANVVKQVLTFARGVEGERVLLKAKHLIEEMIDIARRTFPKSISVRGNYPQDLWSIEGDPTQLHQVLLNLSVNARDAMPEGGSLTFGAENFVVDEHYAAMRPELKRGPYVLISISDTGSGMSRATIDKIFDPFFSTKEVGKGTGLGLSTALGIVKSHGGFISVYSELRKGTTFKIFWPARTSDVEVAMSKAALVPIRGNGEYILVVDDEPNILQSARMIFEKHNYRIVLAADGAEAVALFARQIDPIAGVLTDVAMPYMDGVAFVRALTTLKADIPIVASSGFGDEAAKAELETLGVKNFLSKPYNAEKLLTVIRDALAPSL